MDAFGTTAEQALLRDENQRRSQRDGALLRLLGAVTSIAALLLVALVLFGSHPAPDALLTTAATITAAFAVLAGSVLGVLGLRVQHRATDAAPHGVPNSRFGNPGAPTPNGQPPLNYTGLTTR